MKCKKCGKVNDETCSLGEYGRAHFGTKDKGEYCEPCFDTKYPTLKGKNNEESNE